MKKENKITFREVVWAIVAILILICGGVIIVLGIFGDPLIETEGKYVDCYDKEGNVILEQTCYDAPQTKEQIIGYRIVLLMFGGLFFWIGYYMLIQLKKNYDEAW